MARGSACTTESLEARRLLAVVINEFLAQNTTGLRDSDGDRSDWIELYNDGAAPVDLSGWYLSDTLANPTRWRIPAGVVIGPESYLTLFASSKDRSGPELHTNFALGASGEDLLLTAADGSSLVDSYLAFGAQKPDVSYGRGITRSSTSSQTLVSSSTPKRFHVPTAQNADVDDFWREPAFDHSAWLSHSGPLGFDRGDNQLDATIGTELTTTEMPTSRPTAYIRVPFSVANVAEFTSLTMSMRYDDGFIAFLNGKEVRRAFFQENDSRPNPQWDSSASGNRADLPDVITPITWDLTPFLYMLRDGLNVLAIHGVNQNTTNTDFLIDPVLTSTRATGPIAAQFMTRPTPGAVNGAGYDGIVGDTHFSVDRGFFDAPFQVAISSTTPGASIRYTLDGSEPTPTTGDLYTGPITVDQTTVLRAVAYKTGFRPTNVDTQTYLFLDDVIRQSDADIVQAFTTWGHDKEDADTLHDDPDWEMDPDIVNDPAYATTIKNDLKAVPSVSLVMNWNDLFDGTLVPGTSDTRGIYIAGKSDERSTSFEYFSATGEQVHMDAAVEMQGHSSTTRWNSDKMSFELKFKQPYGATSLNYAFFGSTPGGANAATKFDNLILDAGFNYTWIHANHRQAAVARFVTDQVVADYQNLADGKAPHGRWVHLYLNGLYWGLYNLHEKPTDGFAEAYFGGDKDDYDVIKHNPTPDFTWADGGVTAQNNYSAFLAATRAVEADPNNMAKWNAIEALLDVDDFINYMIVHYYAGNNDWAHNNWYASRSRVDANAKWHFHAWDQEHAFPTDDNQPLGDTIGEDYDATTKDDPSAPTEVHVNLMANAEYKLRFADRVQQLMYNGGLLTPASAKAIYAARVAEIDRAIIAESARWGDNRVPMIVSGAQPYSRTTPYTREDFLTTTNGVYASFFPVRTNIVLGQFSARFWLPTTKAPTYSQYGGSISPGFVLSITKAPNPTAPGKVYYTLDGTDPRLTGGALNPGAMEYTGPLTLSASTRVIARTLAAGVWSAAEDRTFLLTDPFPVRISELHYHPAPRAGVADPEDMEFIELLNTGTHPVSLEGVKITQFSSSPYVFGSGITLGGGERIVVARSPGVFQSVYGTSIRLALNGYSTANLSNTGERIALIGPVGETLQDFVWDDIAPWPVTPDGDGPSLEIIDPLANPADPANWRASAVTGGTPGSDGVVDITSPTVLSSSFDVDQHAFQVIFSEAITLDSLGINDVTILPLGVGGAVAPISFTFDPATFIATFILPPLPNGDYHLRVHAGGVTDLAGNAIQADYDSPPFFVLAGDVNHDRAVNFDDLLIVAQNYGQSGRSFSEGNLTRDLNGNVDFDDLLQLAQNYSTTLMSHTTTRVVAATSKRRARDPAIEI